MILKKVEHFYEASFLSIFTNIKHNIQLTDIGKTVCKIKKLSD